jgi:hypothetical protein
LQNQYQAIVVIDLINYPVTAYPDAISLICAFYLPDSLRARLISQTSDSVSQSLKVLPSNPAFEFFQVAVGCR